MKVRPLFLACATVILLPRGAFAAQIFDFPMPVPILDYDPSVRSTAMGGATAAVFWGVDPNHWANPALLGYVEGIGYEDDLRKWPTFGFSVLSSDYAFEIHDSARRGTIGYGGLGIALTGRPFDGPGGIRTDATLGTFEFLDQVRSWSVGISAARLAETVAAFRHRGAPSFTRYFDAAFGYAQKTVDLSPDVSDDHGVLRDWGLLARAGAPLHVRGMPITLEGAYGYSVLNAGGGAHDMYSVPSRHFRNSVALHASAGHLPTSTPFLPSWIRAGLEPLVSIGYDTEWEHETWYSEGNRHPWGGELALANVLFLRMGSQGYYETHGFGIALPLGVFGGVRYDDARTEGEFSSDIKYRAWSAWVDPLAVMRARR